MEEKQDWLKQVKPEQGWYLSGFADGEGSFNVSLRRRDDHTMHWQIVLTFNVSQKEEYILAMFKKVLGCGRMQARSDGVYYYVVSNPRSIVERVIPFFEKFKFWSQRKRRNFTIFKEIAKLVFPTPGGPAKHKMVCGFLLVMILTAKYSIILSLTTSKP